MRLAVYNVENLFNRAKVMNQADGSDGKQVLKQYADLNDTPISEPLKPLHDGTSMQDIFQHPNFDNGGFPGTFGLCNAANKIDFMLRSPKLFERVQRGSRRPCRQRTISSLIPRGSPKI
jgi:hypothetical protein